MNGIQQNFSVDIKNWGPDQSPKVSRTSQEMMFGSWVKIADNNYCDYQFLHVKCIANEMRFIKDLWGPRPMHLQNFFASSMLSVIPAVFSNSQGREQTRNKAKGKEGGVM